SKPSPPRWHVAGWPGSPRPSRPAPRRARVATRQRTAGTSAGRVIAGSARGIRLVGPGAGTRPLGDRVKQTLFAILEPVIRDRPFLDLFAGSGAAGIEALSRGASLAVFVETDRAAVRAIEQNLATRASAAPRPSSRRRGSRRGSGGTGQLRRTGR